MSEGSMCGRDNHKKGRKQSREGEGSTCGRDRQKQEMLRKQRERDRSRCSKCSTIHGITPNIL